MRMLMNTVVCCFSGPISWLQGFGPRPLWCRETWPNSLRQLKNGIGRVILGRPQSLHLTPVAAQ